MVEGKYVVMKVSKTRFICMYERTVFFYNMETNSTYSLYNYIAIYDNGYEYDKILKKMIGLRMVYTNLESKCRRPK